MHQLKHQFKTYEQSSVINKIQYKHHVGFQQHQTDIQPPATCCGEFPDQ
jgi:hypothetical protein